MDTQGQEEASNGPRICANGCGFFANEPSEMCSKCSRELQAAAERGNAASKTFDSFAPASGTLTPAEVNSSPTASAVAPAASASADSSPSASALVAPQQKPYSDETIASPTQVQPAIAADAPADDRPVQKNTSRCFSCKKKIGLTGFKCRCGYVFCGSHRLAEAHECDFDYKSIGRQNLSKANPVILADRVTRF